MLEGLHSNKSNYYYLVNVHTVPNSKKSLKKFDVGVIVWGGRYSRADAATPKPLHCGKPQQINFTMTTNRDVMGASAISNLNLTICEKK